VNEAGSNKVRSSEPYRTKNYQEGGFLVELNKREEKIWEEKYG